MKEQVQKVIEEIRPGLQGDGGDVELVAVDEESGTVKVRLQGRCSGCPHAAITLKQGIEARIREAIPAVTKVVSVD